jgi:hypothetical protein
MCSSKNVFGVYLLSIFERKMVFLAIFKQKKYGKPPVFSAVFCFSAGRGAYLPPLTLSTPTTCPGTPPTNNRHTKQFLSRRRR